MPAGVRVSRHDGTDPAVMFQHRSAERERARAETSGGGRRGSRAPNRRRISTTGDISMPKLGSAMLAALLTAFAAPAAGQHWSFDARRIAIGGAGASNPSSKSSVDTQNRPSIDT